jgi:electron transport complex protein RnfB
VACMNHERGNRAKQVCAIACTACKICEKNCPDDAIHVVLSTASGSQLGPADNLAVIDFVKCTQCGTCVEKCPQASIVSMSGKYHPKKKEPAAVGAGSASSEGSGGQ